MSLIPHRNRRRWGAAILGLAALAPVVSSCGQPAAVKPIAVAVAAPSRAKENLKALATAVASETAVARANATGIARDEAIVEREQGKLRSYATATAVTIERARQRAIARRTAIAVATATKRAAIEQARAQKTAQAFQALEQKQLADARSLQATVATYCWPGVKTLASVITQGNAALESGRAMPRGAIVGLRAASKDFASCHQQGDKVTFSMAQGPIRSHFRTAVDDFTLALRRVQLGLDYRDAASLQRGATVLWQGNDNLQAVVNTLQQSR